MAKRLTTDDFIKRARDVHGDKYDYSLSEYVSKDKKLKIICPIHGEFEQSPNNHWKGKGCPGCSGNKKLTQEEFIAKAKLIHHDFYDYSNVVYVNVDTPVKICCKKHGPFEQTPYRHLQGRGCPLCGWQKMEQTNLTKYGSVSPFGSSEIQEKASATNLERYGVENVFALPRFQEKSRETCRKKYGADKFQQSEFFQERASEISAKIMETRRQNHTFSTSGPEKFLYDALCNVFEKDDIVQQYKDEKYPFACDFYVKSRAMYIELNASWTHGRMWFDDENEVCLQQMFAWQEKSLDSTYYAKAIETWTTRDVLKREIARQNQLNYIVFWDNQLRDAQLWFACGCPNGTDWNTMYSWLPVRKITGMNEPNLGKIKPTPMQLSALAKYYQFEVFYQNEMQIWEQNPWTHGMPLQIYLYWNRWYYTKKLPIELTDLQLMRGFKISGIHRGYTVFNTALMDEAVNKYQIQSIYDPCAGWGERMLYCYYHDVAYLGRDVNINLKSGYRRMIADLGMKQQRIAFVNSADCPVSGTVDAVLTCPPYYDTEIYSEYGAENLPNSEKFLKWWLDVVRNSLKLHPQYFCFQVNQKWRGSMLSMVEQCGFALIDEFFYQNKQSSHFTRKNGENVKREFESMLVCKHLI